MFNETFPSLTEIKPDVLYPVPGCLDGDQTVSESSLNGLIPSDVNTVFLSVNRYERKKNLALAIEALGELNVAFFIFP